MGTLFIIIGVAFIGTGIFMSISKSNKNATKVTSSEIESSTDTVQPISTFSESRSESSISAVSSTKSPDKKTIDPKQIGNDFEGYMADILKANNIILKQWNQGSTSPEGAYAENELNPDFYVSHILNRKPIEYWVECKYRSTLPYNGFTIEDYQLKRYVGIQKNSKRKIIIALGIGGSAKAPNKIYLIPLDTLNRYKRIGHKYLPEYEILNPRTNFGPHISDWFLNEVFKKNKD